MRHSRHRRGWVLGLALTLLTATTACDSGATETPDVTPLDTVTVEEVSQTDAPSDTVSPPDDIVDASEPDVADTAAPEDTSPPPDTSPAPDTHVEEDLSGVDLTFAKDIKPIADKRCGKCHGKEGSSGLKLYNRDQWELYFPMIVSSIETGKMPKGGNMGPGELLDIKLWGKIGYP